jgi:nitroimidazol reductase NimA-like FMN-containing flavoprotein (pyridoxamine 5'-phosphate oxidase superfamily)
VTRKTPQIRDLDDNDIHSILGRNSVGRLVFDWGGQLDIRPLHYVYSDGRIYGRTSVGAKFARVAKLPAPVVFEVDEVQSVLHWKSVIARGNFYILSPDGPDQEEREKAMHLLRRVIREAFAPEDPLADRDILFRISVHELTGRASE